MAAALVSATPARQRALVMRGYAGWPDAVRGGGSWTAHPPGDARWRLSNGRCLPGLCLRRRTLSLRCTNRLPADRCIIGTFSRVQNAVVCRFCFW